MAFVIEDESSVRNACNGFRDRSRKVIYGRWRRFRIRDVWRDRREIGCGIVSQCEGRRVARLFGSVESGDGNYSVVGELLGHHSLINMALGAAN